MSREHRRRPTEEDADRFIDLLISTAPAMRGSCCASGPTARCMNMRPESLAPAPTVGGWSAPPRGFPAWAANRRTFLNPPRSRQCRSKDGAALSPDPGQVRTRLEPGGHAMIGPEAQKLRDWLESHKFLSLLVYRILPRLYRWSKKRMSWRRLATLLALLLLAYLLGQEALTRRYTVAVSPFPGWGVGILPTRLGNLRFAQTMEMDRATLSEPAQKASCGGASATVRHRKNRVGAIRTEKSGSLAKYTLLGPHSCNTWLAENLYAAILATLKYLQ